MFTGIIEETGSIKEIHKDRESRKLVISATFASELKIDQSICINGACHTVMKLIPGGFVVQSVEETLRKTNIGTLKIGQLVNLERSVSLTKLLDGHLVQGHVDTTGTITTIKQEGTDRLLTISYPEEHHHLIVGRGSIAVEGISLTVAQEQNDKFTVAIIPYTWDHTNLKYKSRNSTVNLEFDILGKYVARHLENRGN